MEPARRFRLSHKSLSPKEAATAPHFLEIAASFVALLLGLTVWGEAPARMADFRVRAR
jgi:hypothetical protein